MVKAVVIDMYKNYRDAAYGNLPGARIIVDKNHILKMSNAALDDYRKAYTGKLSTLGLNDAEKKEIKGGNKLLQLSGKKLSVNQKLQMEIWRTKAPQLNQAYSIKEEFYEIFNSSDCDTRTRGYAESLYDKWMAGIPDDLLPYFSKLTTAVENWHLEIFNYFDQTPRLTNGPTENLNERIRKHYDNGSGYSFEVLRAKLLYGGAADVQEEKQTYPRTKKKQEQRKQSENTSTFSTFPSSREETVAETEMLYFGSSIPKLIEMFDDDKI